MLVAKNIEYTIKTKPKNMQYYSFVVINFEVLFSKIVIILRRVDYL